MIDIAPAAGFAAQVLGTGSGAAHLYPEDAAALAQVLGEACAAGQKVIPWGGGTEQALGAPPRACDLVLHTSGLSGLIAYAPEDLTVSVRAGTSLAEVRRVLAEHGQFLPLDVPGLELATVGGVVATAASPVRRFRYGGVRDQVIGLEVALPDGSLTKTGGRVVKNVAGYDLCKLFTGSLGTLGVIVSANFKVHPLPRAGAVLRGHFTELGAGLKVAAALASTALGYSALMLEYRVGGPGCDLVVIAEGFAGAVARQVRDARHAMQEGGATSEAHEGVQAAAAAVTTLAAWRLEGSGEQPLLRGAVPPGRLTQALPALAAVLQQHDLAGALQADAGVGSFFLRAGAGRETEMPGLISQARVVLHPLGGHLVIAAAPVGLRRSVDPWAAAASGKALALAIKDRIDPGACLNPGRFAHGI